MVFEMIARKIIHIDMDAFYASVEIVNVPEPLEVAALSETRT